MTVSGPIDAGEWGERRKRAQAFLQREGYAAMVLEAGVDMEYFTGVSWWPSERPLLYLLPRRRGASLDRSGPSSVRSY